MNIGDIVQFRNMNDADYDARVAKVHTRPPREGEGDVPVETGVLDLELVGRSVKPVTGIRPAPDPEKPALFTWRPS